MISRIPKEKKFATKLLFVHGAWHGAWCWKGFMDYFSGRGFSCWALDLPGHGERSGEPGLWKTSMMDYVDEVDRAAKEIGNPVIIAHSMGGFVAMKYLETRQASGGGPRRPHDVPQPPPADVSQDGRSSTR